MIFDFKSLTNYFKTMNILDLLKDNDMIQSYAEKFGLDQEQLTNIVSNALPMLKDGNTKLGDIAGKVSESTGISTENIEPLLTQFAPKIQEIFNGNGGGIGDLLGGFLGGENKAEGLGDLLEGFLGKK